MAPEISMSDYIGILNAAYDLCRSYDTKDWDQLRRCLAPTSFVDFRALQGELHEDLTPDGCVAVLSSMLVDKLVKTQHLLGAGRWECLSDGTVNVVWQIRAKHFRFEDETFTTVVSKGHGYGSQRQWYRKIDGVWKITGVAPSVDFTEYDMFGTVKLPQA